MSQYYGASEAVYLCNLVEKIHEYFRSKMRQCLKKIKSVVVYLPLCAHYFGSLHTDNSENMRIRYHWATLGNVAFSSNLIFFTGFSLQKLNRLGPYPHPNLARYLWQHRKVVCFCTELLLKHIQLRNVSEATSGSYLCVVTGPKPTYFTYTTR